MTFELIDVRNQYTNHLKKIMVDHLWDGINSLYIKSRELKGPWIQTFQTFLKDIKNWNMDQINSAAKDIQDAVNQKSVNFLKELLTTIIVLNVKVLSSASANAETGHIEINVPPMSEFIYDIYKATAKKIYNNPSLFDHNVNLKNLQLNIEISYKIIATSIEEILSTYLPYESLISQYLEHMNHSETNLMDKDKVMVDTESLNTKPLLKEGSEQGSEQGKEVVLDDKDFEQILRDDQPLKKITIPDKKRSQTFFSDAESDAESE